MSPAARTSATCGTSGFAPPHPPNGSVCAAITFKMLDLLGSFSYSSATSSTPLDESFNGLITRTNTRAFTGTGTAAANRISDVVDLEATLHLTQHLRLIEKFYFWAYRIPENGNFNEIDYSCAPPPCTLLTTPLTTPTPPGRTPTLTLSSFNQTWKRNQTELAWDISKKAGARIGFRYGDRVFNHFIDLSARRRRPFRVDGNKRRCSGSGHGLPIPCD